MQVSTYIIAVLAVLNLVSMPKIISFLKISGKCLMFARQNIQTNKIKHIKNLRAFVFSLAIAALTLTIWLEPSWMWSLIAGCQVLRTILILAARPKHDRNIFRSAFSAYYTVYPLCILAILPLACLLRFLGCGAALFFGGIVFVFVLFYLRIFRIEFQLLKGDFSSIAIFSYILLIELIPVGITLICYFFLK